MTEYFHPDTVAEDEIHFYATRDKYLDADADSKVFRVGDWVLKEYYRLSVAQATIYQLVTNIGVNLAPEYGMEIRGYGDTNLAVTPMSLLIPEGLRLLDEVGNWFSTTNNRLAFS